MLQLDFSLNVTQLFNGGLAVIGTDFFKIKKKHIEVDDDDDDDKH